MARVTVNELQQQIQSLRNQLDTQKQLNQELREEMVKIRSVTAIAMNVLERAVRS